MLEVAGRLFYARGVHEVGMDALVAATGMGKASVYRLFPSKDALVAAWLHRLAGEIAAAVDAVGESHAGDPRGALLGVLDAIEADLRRDGFRGCPFHNASTEFDDARHPVRAEAASYRRQLLGQLEALATALDPAGGAALAATLAVLVDGAYTSAAHLGPDGPAAAGLAHARHLVAAAPTSR